MTSVEDYRKAVEFARKIKVDIVNAFKKDLNNVDDIEGLTRSNSSVYGFTISSKTLSSESWLPIYYDNKLIAKRICDGFKGTQSLEQISKYLNEIVTTRKVKGERINPKMVEELQLIINKYGLSEI